MHVQVSASVIAHDVGNGGDTGSGELVAVAMGGKVIGNTVAPGGGYGGEIKLFSVLRHEEAIVIAQRRILEAPTRSLRSGRCWRISI